MSTPIEIEQEDSTSIEEPEKDIEMMKGIIEIAKDVPKTISTLIPSQIRKLSERIENTCQSPDFNFNFNFLGDDRRTSILNINGQQSMRWTYTLSGKDYKKGNLEDSKEAVDKKQTGLFAKMKKRAKFVKVVFKGPLPGMVLNAELSFKGKELIIAIEGITKIGPPTDGENYTRYLNDIRLIGVDNGSSTKDELNFTNSETKLLSGAGALVLTVQKLPSYLDDNKDMLEISFTKFNLDLDQS